MTKPSTSCCSGSCQPVSTLSRRNFLYLTGSAVAVSAFSRYEAIAGAFDASDFGYTLIPADKKLSKEWLASLVARGNPEVYSGSDLNFIGMPCGGFCTGQLYLGGDGKLWHWDIFNTPARNLVFMTWGPHYARPMGAKSPLEQGFAVRVDGKVRTLDGNGFGDVSFLGEYPIGTVIYRDAGCPVEVVLQAYSPFVPLDHEDSGLPATVMEYSFKNTSDRSVEVEIAGWIENAVCKFSPGAIGTRVNRVVRDGGTLRVDAAAAGTDSGYVVFEDFEGTDYDGWEVEGTAFGDGPFRQSAVPAYQGDLGIHGTGAVNSHASAPGESVEAKDAATGRMISRPFTIAHDVIEFRIGGGQWPETSGLFLLVDGERVRSETGRNANRMGGRHWDVRDLKGKDARFEIVDAPVPGWGNVGVDYIRFRDGGRPDILFADFEGPGYEGWTVEGEAFGGGPVTQEATPAYQNPPEMGMHGNAMVNSHASAVGGPSDEAFGSLVSAPFKIERHFIRFLIGGGQERDHLGLRLTVDGREVRSATGHNTNKLREDYFDIRDLEGKTGQLVITDTLKGTWGNTSVDYIVFSDEGFERVAAVDAPDFGTLTLALVNPGAGDSATADAGGWEPSHVMAALVGKPRDRAESPISGAPPVGAVGRRLTLAPGATAKVPFVVAWHFPGLKYSNPELTKLWNHVLDFDKLKRYYAKRFRDSGEVAVYVAKNFEVLSGRTKLWRDTWYDSTLPYWFLNRTFANLSTLATATCQRFDNGRYWFWEGIYCCQGTCTHVWHYAHGIGRVFPGIERDIRERVDLGIGFQPETGMIAMRAESGFGPATDGHAGTILRIYREHLMSPDKAFLERNWPNIQKAVEWLVKEDGNSDGILTGQQHNTLDAAWYGPISWISSLYVAALEAGAAMAGEMGDKALAHMWKAIATKGSAYIADNLFHNDQYFVQHCPPEHMDKLGSGYGCEIDQVFGQSWAFQVGLPRVLPEEKTRKALESLWRYNFAPDVGPFLKGSPIPGGRVYAMPGEGGLVMCTFPDPAHPGPVGDGVHAFYFNECMTGFEYQVASHMIWEGGNLVEKGLAIVRMIHDRYHPSRRNPWNEIECGDHYGRALASYGAYVAACGFTIDGPAKKIGFAPRLSPENFRAAFIAPEGWGTYTQKAGAGNFDAALSVAYGQLPLVEWEFTMPGSFSPGKAAVRLDGREVPVSFQSKDVRCVLGFPAGFQIPEGGRLEVSLT